VGKPTRLHTWHGLLEEVYGWFAYLRPFPKVYGRFAYFNAAKNRYAVFPAPYQNDLTRPVPDEKVDGMKK